MFKNLIVAAILTAGMAAPATTALAETQAQPAAGHSQEIIGYEKTGGFAGIQRTISVDQDGVARAASAQATAAFQLTAEELGALRGTLGGISTWSSSTRGCDVADHFTYTLRYQGRSAVRCHTLPRDWETAVAQLDRFIDQHLTADRPAARD
ncbi:hypothetical protein [Sphaerisporangium fuscum]|uniref:hypothetical protein n=1 Tax=Sphaerisporangium fuscum TaxID=2835868 RepID=UPI001BDDBE92|nr:hypothetical protein [Sphaerisporangium fuscum]